MHQWGCCVPSRLTSTTLGGLPSLPSRQFTKFQQTSWACYEQDLSLYIYFNLFYAFSPLMSLCLVEGPIPPTWEKKISKKNTNKIKWEDPYAIRTWEVVLVHHNRQAQVNWKQSKGGLLLPSFATMSLDATLLFSANGRPIPPHFPLLRIYFSLRSTSVGYHPQELKIAKQYSKLNWKEYDTYIYFFTKNSLNRLIRKFFLLFN